MSRPAAMFPFSTDGVEIAQKSGVSVPTDARGFIGVGIDGSTMRFHVVDSTGRQVFVGAGVAGTPSGGVLSVQGVSGGQALSVSVASLPLPSGAATEATLATRLAEATFTARVNTLGQKAMTASTPIVIASDQTAIPVSQSGSWTVTTTQGNQGTHGQRWMVGLSDGATFISPATDRVLSTAPFANRLSDGTAFYDAAKTGQLPTSLVGGRLDVVVGAALPSGTNNIGDVDVLSVPAPLSTSGGGTEASALRVTLASDSTGLISVDDNGGSLTIDAPQLPSSLVSGRLDINVGSWLGSTVPIVGQKTMANSLPVTMASNQTPVQVIDAGAAGTAPTFFAIYDRIAPATNKYMALLFNTSLTKKLVVYRINRYNWQVAAVTGQTLEQYMAKISAYTGGTSADIRTTDSADSLPAGITSITGAATVTESFLIRRLFASSEEANLSNANFYNALTLDYSVSIYERTSGTRGIVLRTNEGLAIRNVTNSTAGTVSYVIEFIVEDV